MPDDPLVKEANIEPFIAAWTDEGANATTTVLTTRGLPHDSTDVGQEAADPDDVYPRSSNDLAVLCT